MERYPRVIIYPLAASGSGGIALTGHGQRHAREAFRQHRLIETFLFQAVGPGWEP